MRSPSFSLRDSRAREMRAHVKIASREKCEKWREREKMRDRRKSPIFWLYALLSQRMTLVSSSIVVCQHLSKKHRPLSTLNKITISVNVWQTWGMSRKNSSYNIPEKGTDSSSEALLKGKDVPVIRPTRFGKSLIYQVFSIAQTFANVSILIISPLNLNGIVEEQTKEMNGLGITLVHSKPSSEDCLKDISKAVSNDVRFSWRLLMQEDYRDPESTGTPFRI